MTGFDRWFLDLLARQAAMDKRLLTEPLTKESLLEAKRYGMSDKRIATLCGKTEADVYRMRCEEDVTAVAHHVDTCAGNSRR